MNKIVLPKNHIFLTSSQDISDICKSLLEYFGISYFSYTKVFNDNSHFRLCNHSSWTEFYYSQNFYTKGLDGVISRMPNMFALWSSQDGGPLFVASSNNFNIDYGFSLFNKCNKFLEIFTFATDRRGPEIFEFYLSNVDLLRKFTFYFKEKAHKIISSADDRSNRIFIQNQCQSPPESTIEQREKIQNFLGEIDIKKYYINVSDVEVVLTKPEMACLQLMLKGFSAKEIALAKNISKRTVETHLDNVKKKLLCETKYELIHKVMDYNLDNI